MAMKHRRRASPVKPRPLDPPNWHLVEGEAELRARVVASRMDEAEIENLIHLSLKAAISRRMAFERLSTRSFSRTALLSHECAQASLALCHEMMTKEVN